MSHSVKELLSKREDEIYIIIASELVGESLSAVDKDFDKLVKIGRKWFKENTEDIQRKLCSNESIKKRVEGKYDLVDLVAVISDVISSSVIGVPPFFVAVLIVKTGCHKFCKDYWA